MSDRARGRGRGGGGGGGRGGRGGGRNGNDGRPPRKDPVIDMSKYLDKRIRVKFAGGRVVEGDLKGFDGLYNLVLDDAVEHLRDIANAQSLTGKVQPLGLLVCRGPGLTVISPTDGSEEVPNPFGPGEEPEPVI